MSRRRPIVHAVLVALVAAAIASGAAIASVPSTLAFSARLVDDETGDAVTGTHRFRFELFDAATGGTSVWFEGRDADVEDGVLFVELGETKALAPGMFASKLWLEVTVDDVVMEPRVPLASVPYALRAGDADTVAGMRGEDLQRRVTGVCGTGSFISEVKEDGTVVCAPDLSGSGDITEVIAGSGLQGGGAAGTVTLSLLGTCATDQILKWTGSAWACAPDASSGGDISSVTVGPAGGLSGGNTTGDVQLSLLTTCASGQVLKWSGTQWVCAVDADTDTNSGGDITSVATTPASGLVGGTASGDANLSLLTNCSTGQLLKWNGSAWGCAPDADTDTNSGGDITDVLAGAGLTGGSSTGAATLNVGTGAGISVTPDGIAIDVGYTDPRYVNTTGDTMTGSLDMNQQRLLNRGCPSGYNRHGPGLCVLGSSSPYFGSFTFCANTCRTQGAHMCSAAEMRAAMLSGVSLGAVLGDWMGDQVADDTALYINDGTAPENPDGERSTATASYCRCCVNVE